VAYEEGAVVPSKDCAYEDPVIKAITGLPISMEGKGAACAHLSHVGNVAAAVADLWSNESVQNVKLLSGFAPEVFTEILAYDCRLMNQATATGHGKTLQRLLIDSDEGKSVHALIISPESSFRLAKAIVQERSDFDRTHRAALTACEIIREAVHQERLALPRRELTWLSRIEAQLDEFSDEAKVLDYGQATYAEKYLPGEYGL
jgi:methanol---5-hydroxybenzimidazolylcobamide Co-methyltransferase